VADVIFDEIRAASHDEDWDNGRRIVDEVLSCAGVVGYAMHGAEIDCDLADRPCLD
jgi:hypothetical protein